MTAPLTPEEERRTSRQLARNLKPWREYIEKLTAFASAEGLELEVRNPGAPHYQIARLTGDGVRLIVYPHTANTGNQHPRVRDEGSPNKTQAEAFMRKLGLWVNNRGVLAWSTKFQHKEQTL